jgi:hypothetical protein
MRQMGSRQDHRNDERRIEALAPFRLPLGQTMGKITKSCIEAREPDAYLLVRLTVH